MAPFNSYLYLNNDHNGLPEDGMDSAADIFPTIEESSFYSNFQCCGLSLKDLHELLHHYEESHVRIEDGEDESIGTGMFDFDTVLAADSLLNVGADASNRSKSTEHGLGNVPAGLLAPTPSSVSSMSSKNPSPHAKRPRILTLGIETCDYANDDSEHLSAFDNTVIRPVDPSRMYNPYNGNHGYTRIAPKRSHSVPALPNFPLINGESGFKLIHSILSSTADPPSSDNPAFQNGNSSQNSNHGASSSTSSSASTSGYQSSGYSIGRAGNERPFVCPVGGCGKTYKNANGLKYHAIHGHDGVLVEKPHKCPFSGCGKRYKNSNGLKYHFQHAHPNTPPPSSLAMTPSTSSYSSSSSSGNNYRSSSQSYGYTSSSASNSAALASVPVHAPPRPHSAVNQPTAPSYTRPSPITTSNSSGSSNPSLSSESIQNLLSTAPSAIINMLKKNPNLKQHLPSIIRNLQHIVAQKSNNISQQSMTAQEQEASSNLEAALNNSIRPLSKNN